MSELTRFLQTELVFFPGSFSLAIQILKQSLVGCGAAPQIFIAISMTEACIDRGTLHVSSIVQVLLGMQAFCSKDKVCQRSAKEVARVCLPSTFAELVLSVGPRYQRRGEKLPRSITKLVAQARQHESSKSLAASFSQTEQRTLLLELASLGHAEARHEMDGETASRLLAQAYHLEILASLL